MFLCKVQNIRFRLGRIGYVVLRICFPFPTHDQQIPSLYSVFERVRTTRSLFALFFSLDKFQQYSLLQNMGCCFGVVVVLQCKSSYSHKISYQIKIFKSLIEKYYAAHAPPYRKWNPNIGIVGGIQMKFQIFSENFSKPEMGLQVILLRLYMEHNSEGVRTWVQINVVKQY